MPDKKAVGKKDCAEWVTKRIPFSGAFFHFSLLLPQTFFKKEQNFHCSNGESGEESCCGCLKNGLNHNPQPKKLYSIQIKVKNSSPQSQGSSLHMAFIFTQHIICYINFHMDAGFFDSCKLA